MSRHNRFRGPVKSLAQYLPQLLWVMTIFFNQVSLVIQHGFYSDTYCKKYLLAGHGSVSRSVVLIPEYFILTPDQFSSAEGLRYPLIIQQRQSSVKPKEMNVLCYRMCTLNRFSHDTILE